MTLTITNVLAPNPQTVATNLEELHSKLAGTVSAAAQYQLLAEHFRPLFARIAEDSLQREQERILPFEQVYWIKESGFTTLRVPREHGGLAISNAHLFGLLVELAAADPNVAHLLRSHFSFVETIAAQDPDFQQRWFPRVLAGEIFGNAATERGGNVLGSTNTKLVRQGQDSWVLTGEKYYTTGSIFADWVVVMATSEDLEGRLYALVPSEADGVEILDDWNGFGQPLTGTGTAIFRDVAVEPGNILPRKLTATLEPAFFQLLLLAVTVGIGKAALRDAAELVAARTRTFNTGSGALFRDEPLIQAKVGQLAAKVATAEAVLAASARELDAAVDPELGRTADEAYLHAELAVQQAHAAIPELILDATSMLFDVTGASAVDKSKGLDRHWRNARTVATHNPIVFKERSIGDYYINGAIPQGLNSIGDAPAKEQNK